VQAEEYERGGTVLDSVHKLLNIIGKSHPFPVVRLKELKVWKDSGAYDEMLIGKYRRRGESSDPKKEFEDAVKEYREQLSRTKDPLGEAIQKIGNLAREAGKAAEQQAGEFFKGIFGGGKQE